MAAAVKPTMIPIHKPGAPMPTSKHRYQEATKPRIQKENRLLSMMKFMSLIPRKAPADATWMPSDSWNTAA